MNYEKEILDLVEKELDYEKAKYGDETYNSEHEKYALILEKWERLKTEINDFKDHKKCYWHAVKNDNRGNVVSLLSCMRDDAILAVKELIQVIAIMEKEVNE